MLIVEDHGLLADSLRFSLEAQGITAHVVVPESGARILETAEAVQPTVTLLDLDIGGAVGSSLSLIRPLLDLGSLVVMLTGVTDRVRLAECLETGATGIISKSTSFDGLLEAIKEAAELGSLTRPQQRHELLAELRRQRATDAERRAPFERLTAREAEVLVALMNGESAEHIAEQSFVGLATVRTQIRSILVKFGVKSQLAAVALARRNRWNGRDG